MSSSETAKDFNQAVTNYLSVRNGENERQTERYLQVLAATSDVSLFDPGHKDTVEFYVNLHEMMLSVDPGSSLAWAAIATLREASKNASARHSLIHMYQFMPVLTRYLSTNPRRDREVKLLKLMEELTYGIKISWQEAHLPRLMTALTNLVTPNADQERMTLALSILVNLCYKNLPAVYSLLRTVDIKSFFKTVLQLQGHNDSSKVQVYKLTIILKSVTAGLPEPDVNAYMKSVCPTLINAFRKRNACLMRQSVSFFKEMSRSSKSLLHESISMHDQVQSLLKAVEANEEADFDCVDILFEYLVETLNQSEDMEDLYPDLLKLAFRWVRTEGVSTNALNLVSIVACGLEKSFSHDAECEDGIMEIIDQQLPVILLLLDLDGSAQSNESYGRLSAVLHLLSRMLNTKKFSDKILTSLDPKAFDNLFQRLRLPNLQQNSLFQEAVYMFYIEALVFLQELSNKDASWLIVYSELLRQKQIQYILSVALYLGSEEVKMKVLRITTTPGFSSDCMKSLANGLSELNKLVIFSPSGCKRNESTPADNGMTPMDITPLLTVTQEGHLNSLLDKVERETAKNQNSVTSAVMELYQFKVAAMSQTIRKMQSYQEAADKRATDLQHNLALTTSEVSRLHHLLHSTQQSFEAASNENVKLRARTEDLSQQYALATQNLRSKTRIIQELSTELEEKRTNISSLQKTIEEELSVKKELQNRISDLESQLHTAQESLSNSKLNHKKEMTSLTSTLDELKKDYAKLEKAKLEVDAEAEELNKQLTIISQVAMKRMK